MKKLVSVITALSVLLCVCTPAFAVAAGNDVYPVIIVPGYSSSQLYCLADDGDKEQVWWIGTDRILNLVLDSAAELGLDLGKLALGQAGSIAKTLGEATVELLGKLACNDDGTSKNALSIYYSSAEETCSSYLAEKYSDGSFRHEVEIMDAVAEQTGMENIYNFNCDFRMSVVDCARRLDEYIDDVCEYTGSDKVNIIAVSHGGQVTATYLTLFGDKRAVNNAVLNVPAIGGAGLAYDTLNADFDFDEETLCRFIEHGMMDETDYEWLVKANKLGFLDDILNGYAPYALQIIGLWTSIWDFIPAEYYEAMKAKYLDPSRNAAIITASDYFHNTVEPQFTSSLQRCNDEYGMNVSIIAGTGNPVVSGLKENSDGIITVKSSTGATTAPFGQRFSDGYTAINGDNDYVSPAMDIDASTAYLPDNTWFIDGLFHGMEYKDSYTAALLFKLLLTDDIENVYSDLDFPRFHASTNVSSAVFASFNSSAEGYLGTGDTSLSIKNLSEKYPMRLLAVTCQGIDLNFSLKNVGRLKCGESVSLSLGGSVPQKSETCVSVTVTYMLIGSPTPVNERTLWFKLTDGEAPDYNENAPYTALDTGSVSDHISGFLARFLTAVGLRPFVSILYHIFTFFNENLAAL